MPRIFIFLFASLACAGLVSAQTDSVYTMKYIDRSTRFAWTTLGLDMLSVGGGQVDYFKAGNAGTTKFGSTLLPRLSIGGIHFWGHADFYVSFPLRFLALSNNPIEWKKILNNERIETGARLYPWKIKPNSVRPFVGVSFRLKEFSLGEDQATYSKGYPEFQRMTTPVQMGLSYATRKSIFSLSAYYNPQPTSNYYSTPSQTGALQLDTWSFGISMSRYWDTDQSMRNRKSIRQLNLKDIILRKEKRMSAWYWGIGPSGALQMSRSEFLKDYHPYLYDDFAGGIMPDITFGRFFEKPDMNIGISYRTLGMKLQAFETDLRMRRHSFMLEAYKNIFNYLGFVPYVGVTGSIENLTTIINGVAYAETKPAVGIIFGWDIRVTKTETNLLRTNLRWIPDLHMTIQGKKMMYDQIEFNFIQWVQFIGRKKAFKKYRR